MNLPDGKEDGALPAKVTAAQHLRVSDVCSAPRTPPRRALRTAKHSIKMKEVLSADGISA